MCISSNKKIKIENDHKVLNDTTENEFEDVKVDGWTFSDYEDSDTEVILKEEDCSVCISLTVIERLIFYEL